MITTADVLLVCAHLSQGGPDKSLFFKSTLYSQIQRNSLCILKSSAILAALHVPSTSTPS
jgi:hypothetical protein